LLSLTGDDVPAADLKEKDNMVYTKNNPAFYTGSDSERIEQAQVYAQSHNLPLEITRRPVKGDDQRDFWCIDRAILLPADSEVRIVDCKIKLSDKCRDNFFRSANCGLGIPQISPLKNIRIIGAGETVLEGADLPRATGDGVKVLGVQTYGTDAGKADEYQKGDWRNIGILFAEVANFQIKNLLIRNYHCWAISLEFCKDGVVSDIQFDATQKTIIHGKSGTILNQDGIDLRNGCSDIRIENIDGRTGDDMVALTALRSSAPHPAGGHSTMISASCDRGEEGEDIRNIEIRNVRGYSAGEHHIVRLLNASGIKIHHVTLENVEDRSPAGCTMRAAVKIGDDDPAWGGVTPLGDTFAIQVKKVRSKAKKAIYIAGSLMDSNISEVENCNPDGALFELESGKEMLKDVRLNGE
jgi:hypothetical protein